MRKIYGVGAAVIIASIVAGTLLLNQRSAPASNNGSPPVADVYLPRFHIFNFEFHQMHVDGNVYSAPSYVSFFVQNMGNGSATEVAITFVINATNPENNVTLHASKLLPVLASGEVRSYEVDVEEGTVAQQLDVATAKIECKEGVVEDFTFS